MTTVAIGSDHAGFALKTHLAQWLTSAGYVVRDVGCLSDERTDYPLWGAAVGRAVTSGEAEFGIAICGSGEGICMAVNKIPGTRAGVVRSTWDAEMIRAHNDANVACFGERVTPAEDAVEMTRLFLTTPFEGGRHQGRVDLLAELDGSRDTSGE